MSPVSRLPAPSPQELSRRAALQLIAVGVASLAAGCKEPDEKIVAQDTVTELPYAHLPEGLLPGIAKHYATTLPLSGYGRGAIVTAFEGRPTKIEGNPRHPASLGGTDVFAQAEILGLYDPNRSQAVRLAGEIADRPAFESAFRAQMGSHAADKGAGLRLLSGRITSPTLLDQIAALKARYPDLRWHRFEPADDDDIEFGVHGLRTGIEAKAEAHGRRRRRRVRRRPSRAGLRAGRERKGARQPARERPAPFQRRMRHDAHRRFR